MPGHAQPSPREVFAGINPDTGASTISGLPTTAPVRLINRPKGYGGWSLTKRAEYTFGTGLLNLETILAWDPDQLDDTRFRAWKEATLAIVHMGLKAGLQRARARDNLALAEIKRGLAARGATGVQHADQDADTSKG